MNVEMFIRFLGYIVYTLLWSPVIVLCLIILPIAYMIMFKSVTEGLKLYCQALEANIRHDIEFIKTGVWA